MSLKTRVGRAYEFTKRLKRQGEPEPFGDSRVYALRLYESQAYPSEMYPFSPSESDLNFLIRTHYSLELHRLAHKHFKHPFPHSQHLQNIEILLTELGVKKLGDQWVKDILAKHKVEALQDLELIIKVIEESE